MKRVVVTGIGAISSLGTSINKIWPNLILGKSAVTTLPKEYDVYPCRFASQIDSETFNNVKNECLNSSEKKTMSRSAILLMKAAEEAASQANFSSLNHENFHRYGVSTGIGMDSILTSIEETKNIFSKLPYNAVGPYALTKGLGNMPNAHLSIRYKFQGPSRSANSACAASLQAIGDAFRALQSGEVDLMLAGGVDAVINPYSIAAFSRIHGLSMTGESRPFDRSRKGFVMAEGAGILVLETEEHARQRNQTPLAEIFGFGQACDTVSLVAPCSSGDGAYRAMRAALESAQLGPEQVGLVAAHATGTPVGDLAECKAISRLFGRRPLVASTKGQLAHCMGGSGGIETALVVRNVLEGVIPPNGNLDNPDPAITKLVNLVPGGHLPLPWLPEKHSKFIIKNSFGFGGANCSLVLGPLVTQTDSLRHT